MTTVIIVIILLSLALVVIPRITIQTLTIAGLLMGGLFMIGAKQASNTSKVSTSTSKVSTSPAPVATPEPVVKLIPKPTSTPVAKPTPAHMSDSYQQCAFSYATMIRGIDMNAPDLQFRAYMAYQDCRDVNPQYSREAYTLSQELR